MRTGWSPAFSSQKSSEVDRLTVGANYGGNQANLCSSGRWPVENNPEESKQVPAKNFGWGRSNDLWTCKRYWRPTSGGQLWAGLSWPITQRKGKFVTPDKWNRISLSFIWRFLMCFNNAVNSHSKYMNIPHCLCHICCTFTHKYQTMLSEGSALVFHTNLTSFPELPSKHYKNISLPEGSKKKPQEIWGQPNTKCVKHSSASRQM